MQNQNFHEIKIATRLLTKLYKRRYKNQTKANLVYESHDESLNEMIINI